jgi:hypothetical protein
VPPDRHAHGFGNAAGAAGFLGGDQRTPTGGWASPSQPAGISGPVDRVRRGDERTETACCGRRGSSGPWPAAWPSVSGYSPGRAERQAADGCAACGGPGRDCRFRVGWAASHQGACARSQSGFIPSPRLARRSVRVGAAAHPGLRPAARPLPRWRAAPPTEWEYLVLAGCCSAKIVPGPALLPLQRLRAAATRGPCRQRDRD